MGTRHVAVLVAIALVVSACANGAPSPREPSSRAPTPRVVSRPSPTPTLLPVLETAAANVYVDPVGSLRFLFEVRNENDYLVERVRAQVILSDDEGKVVASQSGYVKLDLLSPGETAPVMVVLFLDAPDFAAYEIRVDAHRADFMAELLHPSLQVVDDSGRVGEWVPYEVLGEVRNAGTVDAEAVTLAATCYDAKGIIVAIGSGSPEDRVILAGDSSPFLISIGAVAGEVDHCKVQVEGLALKAN